MVTYSEWVQPPDYTVTLPPTNHNHATNTTTYVELLDPATNQPPADEGKLGQVVGASANSGFGVEGPSIGQGSPPSLLDAGYDFQGGIVSNKGTIYRASRSQPLWGFSAWVNYGNFYSGNHPFPPGATGIEWEGGSRRSRVLQAILSYHLANPDIDDSNGGGPTIGGVWFSHVALYDNAVFDPIQRDVLTHWDGALDRGGAWVDTYGKGTGAANTYEPRGPINVTDYLYGDPEDGFLAVSVDFDLQQLPSMASYSDDETGYHIGAHLSGVEITYTLQPPRYRWVYGTATPHRRPSHQRIVQRGNDGLGVTGGRRIIGAKSTQATNRRGTAFR